MYSILRWPAFVLRRVCFCPNNIFCKHSTLHTHSDQACCIFMLSLLKINYTVYSSPAPCGFPSTNRRGSASPGQQIGCVCNLSAAKDFSPLNFLLHPPVISITSRLELTHLILNFPGLHCIWRSFDDTVAHWCPKAYHPYSQGLRILLMNILPDAITSAIIFLGCALGRKLESKQLLLDFMYKKRVEL